MPIPMAEQENQLNYPRLDGVITFSTSDPNEAKRMMEEHGIQPDRVSFEEKEPVAWVFHVPASEWTISFRPKRKFTEAERQAVSERMKRLQAERRNAE